MSDKTVPKVVLPTIVFSMEVCAVLFVLLKDLL